jgi:serine/threonine-protein kinase
VAADLSPALDAPLLRMLEKDPAARPTTVGEATSALIEAARGAGYEVPAQAHRTGDGAGAGAGSGAVHIVKGDASGTAKTEELAATVAVAAAKSKTALSQTETALQTSVVKESRAEPARAAARRAPVFLVAVALGGGVIAALVVGLGRGEVKLDAASGQVATKPDAVEASSAQLAAAPLAPPSAAQAAPTIAPASGSAAQDEVALTVQATPDDLEVWQDGKLVGKAPGPLRLPRGRSAQLVFKAPGYQEQRREVQADADGTLAVSLQKRAAPPRKPGTRNGDLENPFQ